MTPPREDLAYVAVEPMIVVHARRHWRIAGIAAANVGLTTLTGMACHLLGL